MLMQAGVDIWQEDDEGTLAEPGPEASTKVRMWWYEAIARDTSEAKKNLNDAANAISVVAALVATASYVGPLQPPLGYGTTDPSVLDMVQTTKLSIRVFVVTNCLSFYLAIGSILFAVVPSLPTPQESLHEEWRRSKRTIGIAILFLLMSIVGVLISFAAASNVGMADHYSWHGSGLAFYPTMFGGLICLFGIITFFVRLLRLVFDKNERIRRLYQKLPKV
jgi:MFS family permease